MNIHEGKDKTSVSSLMIGLVLSLRFERPTDYRDKYITNLRHALCMSFLCFVFCLNTSQ